jgi:hypothetical protein
MSIKMCPDRMTQAQSYGKEEAEHIATHLYLSSKKLGRCVAVVIWTVTFMMVRRVRKCGKLALGSPIRRLSITA